MKKLITLICCIAAILFCVLIGSLIGSGLAGADRITVSSSAAAVSAVDSGAAA